MTKEFKIILTGLSFFVIIYIPFIIFYSENNSISQGTQLLVAGTMFFFSVLVSYLLYSRNVVTGVNTNSENKNSFFWISVTPLILFVSLLVYVLLNWHP